MDHEMCRNERLSAQKPMSEPLPTFDLSPPVPPGATSTQCIEMWVDLMNACDEFLVAALRREVGPEGDVRAAYREWYWQQMDEHDKAIFRMLERLDEAWEKNGR